MQRNSLLIVVVSLAVVLSGVLAAAAQAPTPAKTFPAAPFLQALTPPYPLGTAFTYQGQLKNSGTPVNGTCGMGFHLFDDPSAGNEIGTPLTPTITATNGIFTTLLDFGPGAFTGNARWLEMRVSCPLVAGSFVKMAPREAVTPAPMALALPGLWTQQTLGTISLIGGYSGNVIASGVLGAAIGGGGAPGASNRILSGADYAVVGGGIYNSAGGLRSVVAGGNGNNVASTDSAIAGGYHNGVTSGAFNAFIGGGQENMITGTAHHVYIGGGENNRVGSNSDHALIAGGQDNSIQAYAFQSVIGGGQGNSNSGSWGTIAGGLANMANGTYAAVPGGQNNIASGQGSFAAGQYAQAIHDGSFVWADGNGGVFASLHPNMFMARATGGFYFADGTGVCQLLQNSSSWSCSSDRALKTNVANADGKDVLARLAAMPISFWSMKAQDPSIRHIGPMAQDFYASFNVGEDNTHIGLLDEGGVALAAIQGLNQLVQEQQAEISALKGERAVQQQQLAALDARVSAQDARLSALEQAVGVSSGPARPRDSFSALSLLLLGGLSGAVGLLFFQRRGGVHDIAKGVSGWHGVNRTNPKA